MTSPATKDKPMAFRICYKYEENDITRYTYSPVVITTYNEINTRQK